MRGIMKNDNNAENQDRKIKISFHHAMHIILLLAVVISIVLLIRKFSNWGVLVDINNLADDPDDRYPNCMDEFFPLLTGTEDAVNDDGITNILVFGNHPFSDDRDSEDSLANIIAREANATVYNCAVDGSCLSTQFPYFATDKNPMDAYSFYWLMVLATTDSNAQYYPAAVEALGDEAPAEAQEVYDTLTSLDFNTIDVVVVMYDATDYFLWRNLYNPEDSTDITGFAGGLEAGIELLQTYYPNIRIIVMSPPYAFAKVHGEYISSDIRLVNGEFGLSSYVGLEAQAAFSRGVSFVDNLYGSIHEDNASEYLLDNFHLNVEGRKIVADHFIYALNYYNKKE